MRRNAALEHGFTLVEMVVIIVVLAVGLTAYLVLVNQTLARSGNPLIEQQAYAVAQSYMEEVLSQPFCDPDFSTDCPTACTSSSACSACNAVEGSRASYDSVCDYASLSDTDAADFTGGVSGLEGYNVDVTVADSGVTLGTLSSATGQVLRVDVRVRHAGAGVDVTLHAYKVNF